MEKICITGANGFIGKSLCKALNSSDKSIRGFIRTLDLNKNYTKIEYLVSELNISRVTASGYLNKLATDGILKKEKVGKSNYYINENLVEILIK